MDPNPNSSKVDRKTIEKNRRNQMKSLYSTLTSLVPHQSPRDVASVPDQLERAANYIKKLEANLEKMKEKKERLISGPTTGSSSGSGPNHLPSIDVRVMGSTLEVVLVCGPTCRLVLSDVIQVLLHEEGADVVTASFSELENMSIHTIHCKICGDRWSQKYAAERIYERLRSM